MCTISLIKISELQRFKRLDAEYYQPLYLLYYEKLKSLNAIALGDKSYAKVTDGIHASIEYDLESGIRCLSAQSVKKGYFDLSANTFISCRQHNQNLKTNLQVGNVIISSVGTIGNCAVVTDEILPANTDRHVGIVTTKDKLNPFYLCAFLLSKYGRFQTERESTGNMQKNLFIDKMKELLIPLLPQQVGIANAMQQARLLMHKSEDLFQEAQYKLLSLLGLSLNIEKVHTITYVTSYSATRECHRIDAEYYQPKYEHVLNKIRAYSNGYCALVDKAPLSKSKISPEKVAEKKFAYVELASVNESFGTIDEYTVATGNSAPSRARMLLKEGDVIASAVEGSLSKVALVSERFNNAVGSTGFFVFRPKSDILSGYLLALIKSPIVQLQLQRESSGTILTSVSKMSVKKIIVPDLPKEKQESINDIVSESHKLRVQARTLIDEAIETVETSIDNVHVRFEKHQPIFDKESRQPKT